jgi:uncharacterized membrane protein YfhO
MEIIITWNLLLLLSLENYVHYYMEIIIIIIWKLFILLDGNYYYHMYYIIIILFLQIFILAAFTPYPLVCSI